MGKASGIIAKFLLLLCLNLFGGIQRAEGVLAEERVCPHNTEQRYIPAGVFTMGSTSEEREYAYRLDKQVTRLYGWYEKETRKEVKTDSFCIDLYPITNGKYKEFLDETGNREPYISPNPTSTRDSWCTLTRRSGSFSGGRALSPQTVRTIPSFL